MAILGSSGCASAFLKLGFLYRARSRKLKLPFALKTMMGRTEWRLYNGQFCYHIFFEALAKKGLSHTMLGSRSEHNKYWTSMSRDFPNHQVADPQYSTPLVLYGDEATVFRQACTRFRFHPLLCENKTNATLSRYLIALVPNKKTTGWFLVQTLNIFSCQGCMFCFFVICAACLYLEFGCEVNGGLCKPYYRKLSTC